MCLIARFVISTPDFGAIDKGSCPISQSDQRRRCAGHARMSNNFRRRKLWSRPIYSRRWTSAHVLDAAAASSSQNRMEGRRSTAARTVPTPRPSSSAHAGHVRSGPSRSARRAARRWRGAVAPADSQASAVRTVEIEASLRGVSRGARQGLRAEAGGACNSFWPLDSGPVPQQ